MLNSIRSLVLFALVLAGPCVASAQGSLPIRPGERVQIEVATTNSKGVAVSVPADAKWSINMNPKMPGGAFPIIFPAVSGNGDPGVLIGTVGDLPAGITFQYTNFYLTIDGTLGGNAYAVVPSTKFQVVAQTTNPTPVGTVAAPTPTVASSEDLIPRNATLKVKVLR